MRIAAALGLAALVASGCGVKGPPLPPEKPGAQARPATGAAAQPEPGAGAGSTCDRGCGEAPAAPAAAAEGR